MSKEDKKKIREAFRSAVFERDGYKCVMCGRSNCKLDAHHVEDRHIMPNGGYVPENGITLCAGEDQDNCHWKAEQYHATGTALPGFSPDDLYAKIGSDWMKAWEASEKLDPKYNPQSFGSRLTKQMYEGLRDIREGNYKVTEVWTYKEKEDAS